MISYVQNYWNLYVDFLERFRSVEYHGTPIVLCSHFYQLIKDNQTVEQFSQNKPSSKQLEPVQTRFNRLLPPGYSQQSHTKSPIVFHDQLLRIPFKLLKKHYHKRDLIILRNQTNPKTSTPFQIEQLNEFEKTTQIKPYQRQLKQLFNKQTYHPVFSDTTFQQNLLNELSKIIPTLQAAENFMKHISVSGFVLGSTNHLEGRALALVARQHGIPTICMQHGIIASPLGYLPKLADFLAVYGNYERNLYLNSGVPSENIKVIGHPRFDEINHPPQTNRRTFNRKLRIHPKQKNILIISHHEQFNDLESIMRELNNQPVNIIIKPRTHVKKLRTYSKRYSNVYLAKGIQLYDLIRYADIVVSYESTVALEAMIASKPVFIWKQNSPNPIDYFQDLDPFFYQESHKLVNNLKYFLGNIRQTSTLTSLESFLTKQGIQLRHSSMLLLKNLIDCELLSQ
ncbi:glycosyltransferase family protein [Alkalibacillus aidingensis]|uniref:hypothetical protein n=1 Tax=Alkalibacillus aidingensis TaxID=2747607 RepID=UPI0016608ACB|nr:hypothetical protein [Alkalibacillus aidingensis]